MTACDSNCSSDSLTVLLRLLATVTLAATKTTPDVNVAVTATSISAASNIASI